jgi:hypothetical protein
MIKIYRRAKSKVRWELVDEFDGVDGAVEQVRSLLMAAPRIEIMVERREVPQP